MDRLLRSNGYFVYSAPPAYKKDKDFPLIWDKLMNLTSAMCWKLIARQVQTAIWIKPENNSCLQQNAQQNLISICDSAENMKPSFQTPLRNCVEERRSQNLPPKPRLSEYSRTLDKLGSLVIILYIHMYISALFSNILSGHFFHTSECDY